MKVIYDTTLLVACLLTALGLRIAVILSQPDQLTIDRDAYLGIATSVAEGRGYSSPNSTTPTAFRPPLYPLTLATGFRFFRQLPVIANVNLLAGLLTVWLTVRLGEHLRLGRLRFVAAFIVAADPLLLQYTSRPMTESLCTLLAAAWLWSMIAGWPIRSSKPIENRDPGKSDNESSHTASTTGLLANASQIASQDSLGRPIVAHAVSALISGIAFGLLVLTRPTFWLIAGFYVLGGLIAQRLRSGKASDAAPVSIFWSGIWSAVGTSITVGPWLIRNWLVFGVPILTTTHGGYTLLLGNNPVFYNEEVRQPWGTVWPEASQRQWEAERKFQFERDLKGVPATEIDEDVWNSRQAKAYIVAEPGHCIEAAIHRARGLWNTGPQGEAAEGVNPRVLRVTRWYYFVVLTLSFLGMALVLRRQDRANWLPLYVLIASVQLVHLLYWTNTRMRAPLTPAIALFAAAVISRPKNA